MNPKVLFLTGPTASGKSSLALELAARLGGEIISADSMQVYRGMDIGTAKPSKAERKKIPHHLMDILPASKSFSVFEYRRLALQKIREVTGRGRLAIVAGGSGLYVRSLVRGLSDFPGENKSLRRRLEREARSQGVGSLYEKLLRADPKAAMRIKPADKKRIIRALEIAQGLRGKKNLRDPEPLASLGFDPLVIGIARDRSELYLAIEKRVDHMFAQGLVAEVKRLLKDGFSKTSAQALGYKEICEALKKKGKGVEALEEARDLIKKNTRHLAKRQRTWFKKEPDIKWYLWTSGETAAGVARKIISDHGLESLREGEREYAQR